MSIISSRNSPALAATPREEGSTRHGAESSLRLRRWPLRDEPRSTALVLVAIGALVAVTAAQTASFALSTLVLALLALADWRSLLPVTYLLDASGIEQRVAFLRRRTAWAAVARCEVWPEGVRLLRSAAGHPLDGLRSFFIPWGNDRDAILTLLARRALRARLVDGQGREVLPSTASHRTTQPSSIPTVRPLPLATALPPSAEPPTTTTSALPPEATD